LEQHANALHIVKLMSPHYLLLH